MRRSRSKRRRMKTMRMMMTTNIAAEGGKRLSSPAARKLQVLPVNPGVQSHSKLSTRSMQTPPLRHGELAHSSMSAKRNKEQIEPVSFRYFIELKTNAN